MSSRRVPGGVVHELPPDLRIALVANPTALDAWKDITPLARNEFISRRDAPAFGVRGVATLWPGAVQAGGFVCAEMRRSTPS